ncbi:uncharacterized protein PRCAT00000667001 [Priceomyces carsonii]|uniref:uncharacterized protein n=1 Tax=Priceomyces carsonii TaxID=28549 RepID=UPI002ED98E9A|nr:unnamed protein product [Priceomyces carsonii]
MSNEIETYNDPDFFNSVDESDVEVINLLCDDVVPNYTINRELLNNWQLELSESIGDYSSLTNSIQQDVILNVPDDPVPSCSEMKALIEKVNCLSEEFSDFKLIVLEIILSICSTSYKTLIHLFKVNFIDTLIDNFLTQAHLSNQIELNRPSLVGQLTRLIIVMSEMGCNVKSLRRLVQPLFDKHSENHMKLLILHLLDQIFVKFPSHFNFYLFNLKHPIALPFSNSAKRLSISSWMKVNRLSQSSDEPLTLFVLASSASSESSTLKVRLVNYEQFMIEIYEDLNNSKSQFSFNQILNIGDMSNQGFFHFTLTYDFYGNLNLFIDGEYSESIPCPSVRKILSTWNKVYIGDILDRKVTIKDEIVLKSFMILGVALSYEWITTLYNLGLGYEWDFQEFTKEHILNMLNHLSPRGLINVGGRINEIKRTKKYENNDLLKPAMNNLNKTRNDFQNIDLINKETIIQSLTSKKFKYDHVLFDIRMYHYSIANGNPKLVLVHDSSSIHGAFYGIGGTSLLLKLIESSLAIDERSFRDTILYEEMKILFTVLNNNWRLSKEFENINGYGILSILLTNYKEVLNMSLSFELIKSFSNNSTNELTGCHGSNLLNLILSHIGYDLINPYESVIANFTCYRFLILNFELFFESESFDYLMYHFLILLQISKFSLFNSFELSKMKLLKKIIQFLKSPSLLEKSNMNFEQIESTLRCVIKADSTVEAIRALSLFIIYALYNEDCSTEIGIRALKALTNTVCDTGSSIKVLKKFSRSITIHWILLIFQFKGSRDVRKCGMRLLTRLLKILGHPVTKKFFQMNHGLDVLTYYMLSWWDDDAILCSIYLSAFGVDPSHKGASDLICISEDVKLNNLIIPEFLILLNNLVLNSMCILSSKYGKSLSSSPNSPARSSADDNMNTSLNVLHLINQYIDSISIGFNKNRILSQFYKTKDWLDGVFELLGHLKLSLAWSNIELLKDFRLCFEKLTNTLSNIFISCIGGDFFAMFEDLNEFTKKLTLELIFPKIFEHINEILSISNYIFNETDFFNSCITIMNYYFDHFLQQHYFINQANLSLYINCVLSIIELNQRGSGKIKLSRNLGELLVIKFLRLENDGNLSNNLNESVKLLLYRQMTILQKQNVNDERLGELITLLLGNFFVLSPQEQRVNLEYVLNFLRTCYIMNQSRFPNIVKDINADASEVILEFFEGLLSKNDDEALIKLQKFPTLNRAFNQKFYYLVGKFKEIEFMNVSDMISVTLNNGGKLGFLNNIYIKSFEKDCEQLKLQIIHGETLKFNRSNQDRQENIQFFVSSYNALKFEISRLMTEPDLRGQYVLDYIENLDAMRKRLVIEDQLAESEKLSYHINIPVKQVDTFSTMEMSNLEDFDYVLASHGIDTMNLSAEDSFINVGSESFEMVNDTSESNDSDSVSAHEDKNRKVIKSLYMGDQIVELWNISQINGLVPIESLMILGTGYLYLIENYFHCPDGNVIDAQDAPVELRDPYLQLINSQSKNILKNDLISHRNKNWGLEKLSCISKRQFLLRDIGLEMFFSDGASILITCLSVKERDSIYSKLYSIASGKGLDYDLTQALQLSSSLATNHALQNGTSYFTSKLASAFTPTSSLSMLSATKKWKMGEMSNFYYLMIINILAGRTFNDLTQYPVFPWVIADYQSESLDLSNPRTFRDLSKPMGAQTPQRSQEFRERFEALDSLNDANSPPFHYGTHYSSAMIVSSYLIRLKPYVQSYLLLQGGKFDHADRLFNSIEKAWLSASRDNTTDVRELIPEFFYLSEFLVNSNNFEFGTLQNGQASNDVELPPWAKGDPKLFIMKNREALESPYVSANLHSWIELIFGSKQSGAEAVEALNVFHHLSYNGAINLDNISDEVEKRAVIGMINNFGQTPVKIFHKPHPIKEVLNISNEYLTLIDSSHHPKLVFESKLKSPIVKIELNSKNKRWIGRPSCISSGDELLIRKAKRAELQSGSLIVNETTFFNIHLSDITCILQIGYKMFLTGSKDGIINVWKCNLGNQVNLQFQCILRGHYAPITHMTFSKSYKIGISLDKDGIIIVWDLSRFKYIRKIYPQGFEGFTVHVSISNDTGNIGLIYSKEDLNILKIYTVNGDIIHTENMGKLPITCFTFGSINDPMVDHSKLPMHINHTYWSSEIVAISSTKTVRLLELRSEPDWHLVEIDIIDITDKVHGRITALELLKRSEMDPDDKLSRGFLTLVMGDLTGKVYKW